MWEASRVAGPASSARRTDDDHLVTGADRARTHHLRAQPTQSPRLALGAVDEGHRVLAEARDELPAPVVRLVGHHDHRALGTTDVELAPRRQVVVGEVEVDEHLVAGEPLATRVLRQELDQPVAHDVELHVRVRRAVDRTTAPPRRPGVTHETAGRVQVADLQHLPIPDGGPPDDGAEHTDVARCRVEGGQEGGQLGSGPMGPEHAPHQHRAGISVQPGEVAGHRLVGGDLGEALTVEPTHVVRHAHGEGLAVSPRGESVAGGLDQRRVQERVAAGRREQGVALGQADLDVGHGRVAGDHHEARLVGLREREVQEVAPARGAYVVEVHGVTVDSPVVRIVVARCQVDYAGRLSAHLPLATRVLMLKSDGSVLIHSDGGSYKPLNWMSPPCTVREGVAEDGRAEWLVSAAKSDDTLRILIDEVLHDTSHDLGVDPGLQKDGVEKHLQELLAEHPATLADGLTLVRREFMTAIGPVDLMCRDADGLSVAVEIKRRGEIDGVEQLTRYLELLNRDPRIAPVTGVFAAQEIKPQARTLAEDRGIRCVVLDYDDMRGIDSGHTRLF